MRIMSKLRFCPPLNSAYFYVDASDLESYFSVKHAHWQDKEADICRLRRGVCHSTFASAAEHCDVFNAICQD